MVRFYLAAKICRWANCFYGYRKQTTYFLLWLVQCATRLPWIQFAQRHIFAAKLKRRPGGFFFNDEQPCYRFLYRGLWLLGPPPISSLRFYTWMLFQWTSQQRSKQKKLQRAPLPQQPAAIYVTIGRRGRSILPTWRKGEKRRVKKG